MHKPNNPENTCNTCMFEGRAVPGYKPCIRCHEFGGYYIPKHTYGAAEQRHDPANEHPDGWAPFVGSAIDGGYKRVYRIYDQKRFEACEGCAYAACFPDASAFDLWTDARRRQGNLDQIGVGTYDGYIVEAMRHFGLTSYRPDEFDGDPTESARGTHLPGLDESIEATERRVVVLDWYQINPHSNHAWDDLLSAMSQGYECVLTFAVKGPLSSVGPRQTIGLNEIGPGAGIRGYHAVRAVGMAPGSLASVRGTVWTGPRMICIQNSWGITWGDKGISQVDASDMGIFNTISVFKVKA